MSALGAKADTRNAEVVGPQCAPISDVPINSAFSQKPTLELECRLHTVFNPAKADRCDSEIKCNLVLRNEISNVGLIFYWKPVARYFLFFALSTLSYVVVAAFAGSISSVESPQPAIYATFFLYAVLWIGWFLFRRSRKQSQKSTVS